MKNIARNLFYSILGAAISNHWYGLLAWFYSKVMEEVTAEGKIVRPSKKSNNKITVLVLSAYAFRKDPECLASSGELRILQIPRNWEARLFCCFYKQKETCCFKKNKLTKYIEDNDQCYQYKKTHRDFLHGFLPKLYKRLEIKCVINPHFRYLPDVDWGSVSKEIGVPYILINRDSRFTANSDNIKRVTGLLESVVKFEGSHMIVQSEYDKQICVNTNYVKKERISALGCMRMDSLLRRIKTAIPNMNSRKKIVFFPFNLRGVLAMAGLAQFFTDVNVALVQLAINHPEIDVVFKPKAEKTPWNKEVNVVFKELGINLQEISNIQVDPYLNVHDLLFEADVFCSLNSTALLEAAIAGKPVIIPYFKEIQKTEYEDCLFFKNCYHLFDVAESMEELESIIIHRLNNPGIDGNIMEGRKVAFENYVSSLNGDATEKCVSLIKRVVAEGSK